MDDLLIQGGHLIDGSGGPGRDADVAVRAGRIAGVEPRSARPAHRVIDARGQIVAPGFIDIHTHSDFTLPLNPRAESKIRQGVTLEVVGNCGAVSGVTGQGKPHPRYYGTHAKILGPWADVAVSTRPGSPTARPTRTRTATPSASPPSWSTARSSSTAATTLARSPRVCSGEGRDLLNLFTALAKRHRTEPLQQLDDRAMADRRPRRTNVR